MILNFIRKIYTSNFKEEFRLNNKYKKEYTLNKFQKEALVGIMLGDGYLERAKPNHNTRLRIE
jgi:hypothetical protein